MRLNCKRIDKTKDKCVGCIKISRRKKILNQRILNHFSTAFAPRRIIEDG